MAFLIYSLPPKKSSIYLGVFEEVKSVTGKVAKLYKVLYKNRGIVIIAYRCFTRKQKEDELMTPGESCSVHFIF